LAEKNLIKGDQVYIEGKLKTRSWDDKDGNKRYTTEVVAEKVTRISSKSEQQGGYAPPPEVSDIQAQKSTTTQSPVSSAQETNKTQDADTDSTDEPTDDLPF
jgi:single-strand DNA-binding protein